MTASQEAPRLQSERQELPHELPGDLAMTTSIRTNKLRGRLSAAFAIGALAVMSVSAYAADDPDGSTTGAPIEEYTAQARVAFDPVSLTTNSGVALLNDDVRDAAEKACYSADPLTDDGEETCVREAVRAAKAQIDAAIARARSTANG
jgi:UrcA family protein